MRHTMERTHQQLRDGHYAYDHRGQVVLVSPPSPQQLPRPMTPGIAPIEVGQRKPDVAAASHSNGSRKSKFSEKGMCIRFGVESKNAVHFCCVAFYNFSSSFFSSMLFAPLQQKDSKVLADYAANLLFCCVHNFTEVQMRSTVTGSMETERACLAATW
jgi:hypothetical protein